MQDIPQAFLDSAVGKEMVENIARICHEANRALCETIDDKSQIEWTEAPDWQHTSARHGVIFHLTGEHGPAASHIAWREQKIADGWKYGEKKDIVAKTHPCIVPYEQLPEEQQMKDKLFRAIVHVFKAELTGDL